MQTYTFDQAACELPEPAIFVGELHSEFTRLVAQAVNETGADRVTVPPTHLTLMQSGSGNDDGLFERDEVPRIAYLVLEDRRVPIHMDPYRSEDNATTLSLGATSVAEIFVNVDTMSFI
jgi:hypothetical protein